MDSFKIKAERKSLWSYCWTSDGSALPVFLHQSLVSFPVFFVSVMYYCLKKKKNHFFALISCIEGRCAVSQMVFGCCCDFCIFCFLEHPVFSDTSYCFFFNRNEHEGIPANLIHHLDVCVEIPQQGIIRSLNVHVSGALLIWEYTRQQVIKQKQRQ